MSRLFHFILYRVPLVMPFLMFIIKKMQFALLGFYKDPSDVNLIKQVANERRMLLQPDEAYTILATARMQSMIEGDMAEVGVFQGASAKLICSVKGERNFWGFDTFSGLQDVSEEDTHWGVSFFKKGQYASSEKNVNEYLSSYEGINLITGYFPESVANHAESDFDKRRFSFVHLDVDTHDSTLNSLRYFWDRMVPGGIILSHDAHAEGVAKAAKTFIEETNARSYRTTGSQIGFIK